MRGVVPTCHWKLAIGRQRIIHHVVRGRFTAKIEVRSEATSRNLGTPGMAAAVSGLGRTSDPRCCWRVAVWRGRHENNEKDGGHDDSTEAHAAEDDSDDSLAGNA